MPREQQDQRKTQKTQSKSRAYLVCGFIVIAAAVLFFLPAILVNTPLKRTAINWATRDLAGTVDMDSISAGWLTPIEINQTVLKDEQGNEVLSVAKIKTDQTLLGILSGNYGNLTIEQPALDLKLRPDGSNLEDILADYTNTPNSQSETANSDLPTININITDAMVRLQSELLPNSTVIENINAQFKIADQEAAVNGTLTIGKSNLTTPSLDAQIILDPGQKQILGQSLKLVADTEKLQLADFAPVLTRILGPANVAGMVNGSINIQHTEELSEIEFTNFATNQLAFLAPILLGQDQFSAQTITMAGRISANLQHIFADNFKAESEFARVSANGEFDLQQLGKLTNGLTRGEQLPDSRFQIDGVVDLAQFTKMLPETTRIREGVQMNSGLLQITATARKENGSPRLVFNADAANMDFVVDGRQIHWNKPLRAVAVAGSRDGQIFLEDIRLASEFLTAAGHATLTSGNINLSGDLAKVMNQVGQVIDTGDVILAGIANGQIQWQTSSDSSATASEKPIPIQLVGNIDIKNPKFQLPGFQPWQDQSIQLTIDSTAQVSATETTTFDSAIINGQIGKETFSATLAKPITDLANNPRWQFNCTANGSVARWIAHARNFTTFPAFFCDGNLQSKFLLTVGPQAIRLNQIQFTSQDFGFDGFALNIREPKVTGRGNIKYDLTTGTIEFTKARISSAAFAGNADSIQMDLSRKILVHGSLNFRADANRASNWIGFSMPNDSVRWDGDVTGTMNFSSNSDALGGQLTAKVSDLVFVQPVAAPHPNTTNQLVSNQRNYAEYWREPDLNLSSGIRLSDDFNNLRLDELTLRCKTADVKVSGTINNLAQEMLADLKGQWRVDWQTVSQTVKELAGDVVQFRGDQWQPIHIQGPLYSTEDYQWIPNQLAAVAKLQWQQANIYNIPLGTNQIDIRVDQSLANLTTTANNNILDRVFGMQPVVDLRRADPIIYLREGNLLDQWAISAEDSRTWLKYVAPLIADATSANGNVSADLKGAAIPIFDPITASAQGTINVHQLTVGAGPLVRQLIPLIDQVRTALNPGANSLEEKTSWLQLRPQQLPFTVQNGRVHHSDFEMKYKDVIVQTSGSVGFDQTINMVAKIPINEDWVAGNKTLSRLAGKSISIPIGGNLSRPQMDRGAVTQFVSNLLRETAVGAAQEKVGEEVGKLQNKLNTEVQDGLNEFQQKLNNKFKSEVEDKLQNELQNGFKKLFGGGKK